MHDKTWIIGSVAPIAFAAAIAYQTDEPVDGDDFFPFTSIPGKDASPDEFTAIGLSACATNADGDLHVCGVKDDSRIWHAIRDARAGTWGEGFRDIQAETDKDGGHLAAVARTACAVSPNGDLHVLAITSVFFDLYHTIRSANGTWPYPFSWVNAEARRNGPEIVGPTPVAACAADQQGNLHLVALNRAGQIYHTVRYFAAGLFGPPGSWHQWGNVQNVVDPLGVALGPALLPGDQRTSVGCATDRGGNLHVCVLDQQHKLRHTLRDANTGAWTAWGDVEAQTGPLPIIANVACTCGPDGSLDVYVTDDDREAYFVARKPTGNWTKVRNVTKDLGAAGDGPPIYGHLYSLSASHD